MGVEVGARSTPPLSCRTSPPQGGRSTCGEVSPITKVAIWRKGCALPISLLEGEMPGRAEGGKATDRNRSFPLLSGDHIEALIFSATSGETHFVQISSWFSRKYSAPSSLVPWFSSIQARTSATVLLSQLRALM